MLEKLVLAMVPVTLWSSVLIAGLMLLRKAAGGRIAARFFRLAWLVLAVRLALPLPLTLPQQAVTLPLPGVGAGKIQTTFEQAAPLAQKEPAQAENGQHTGEKAAPQQPSISPTQPQQNAPQTRSGAWMLFAFKWVWLTGAVVVLTLHLVPYVGFCARLRKTRESDPAAQQTAAQQGRALRVYRSEAVSSPLLAGLLCPAVYLPLHTSKNALPFVLAHEVRHARCGDVAAKFLLLAAAAVHWYNPLVWWMLQTAQADIELACDEAVLEHRPLAYRCVYGQTVLQTLAASRRAAALSTGFAGGRKALRLRFERIVDTAPARRAKPLLVLLCAAVAAASLLIGCAPAAQSPQNPVPETSAPSESATAPFGPARSKLVTQWLWPLPEEYTTVKHTEGMAAQGIDISAPAGTPVYAAAEGTLALTMGETPAESILTVKQKNASAVYKNLGLLAEGLADGMPVAQGQLLGYVGMEEAAQKSYLHFELTEGVTVLDPLFYLHAAWQAPVQAQGVSVQLQADGSIAYHTPVAAEVAAVGYGVVQAVEQTPAGYRLTILYENALLAVLEPMKSVDAELAQGVSVAPQRVLGRTASGGVLSFSVQQNGKSVAAGDCLRSTAPQSGTQPVPELVGLSVDDAAVQNLRAQGYHIVLPENAQGTIITAQQPHAGVRLATGGAIVLETQPAQTAFQWPISTEAITKTGKFGRKIDGAMHKGMDLAAPRGTPVYAAADGVVEECTNLHWSYGNAIKIDHGSEMETLYAHLLKIEPSIEKGASVKQGQLIGTVGSTGNTTGVQLHFEVLQEGVPQDPLDFLVKQE